MKDWLAVALQRSVFGRALKVAAFIGTLLGLINHWNSVLAGAFTAQEWTQIALTYVVPYCVSTYSSVQALRHSRTGGSPEDG